MFLKFTQKFGVLVSLMALGILTTVAFGNFNFFAAYGTPCTLNKNQTVKVWNKNLGIRSGIKAENAAYGMLDFEGNKPSMKDGKWVYNPSGDVARCDRWENHLYNTIWLIDSLAQGKFNLLIVTNAVATAERYNAPGGRGDHKTFEKVNRLPEDSEIIASQQFQKGDVETAYNWVVEELNRD